MKTHRLDLHAFQKAEAITPRAATRRGASDLPG